MPDSREARIKALLGAIELYDGLAAGRYLVYDKTNYRFFDRHYRTMVERRTALEDLLKDVRGR